jgi:L-alanine-DL-glutamate epimerase-like enolase superfamily enzyme
MAVWDILGKADGVPILADEILSNVQEARGLARAGAAERSNLEFA